MNEKIKELRNQSGGVFYEGWFGSPGTLQFTEGEFEKFAELLIQECAKIGSRAMYPDSDPDYVGRKIKQHFGVE